MEVSCKSCEGTGRIICCRCRGTKRDLVIPQALCPTCIGLGEIACTVCQGTGRVRIAQHSSADHVSVSG